jgi:hypothetical protein
MVRAQQSAQSVSSSPGSKSTQGTNPPSRTTFQSIERGASQLEEQHSTLNRYHHLPQGVPQLPYAPAHGQQRLPLSQKPLFSPILPSESMGTTSHETAAQGAATAGGGQQNRYDAWRNPSFASLAAPYIETLGINMPRATPVYLSGNSPNNALVAQTHESHILTPANSTSAVSPRFCYDV